MGTRGKKINIALEYMFKFRKFKRWFKEWYFIRHGIPRSILKNIQSVGFPILDIMGDFSCFGKLDMVNTAEGSVLGVARPCKFKVYPNASLTFKGRCGMSNTVIVATKSITIGNNVMIGGGCTIVDSDFHTMDYSKWFSPKDKELMERKEVQIGDNVFLGANCFILKGVHIGNGAVLAAGSVVTKNIPENQIWGGNPAKFIKNRE